MISLETKFNFNTLLAAAKEEDLAVVSCEDAKGKQFDVLVAVCPDIENLDEYAYIPFALMLTPNLYPLINRLQPPDKLKGRWVWDDDI